MIAYLVEFQTRGQLVIICHETVLSNNQLIRPIRYNVGRYGCDTVYLCHSDDQAQTFTKPVPIAGPVGTSRTFVPTLWEDPTGKLWYIYNRGDREKAEHGVYARTCADPDAATPMWSDEFRVGFDEVPLSFRMNKPTLSSTGQWIMPVTHAAEPTHDWFAGPKQLQGVGISTDNGRTWTLHGAVKAPHWALENVIVQLQDGRLWMLIRAGRGRLDLDRLRPRSAGSGRNPAGSFSGRGCGRRHRCLRSSASATCHQQAEVIERRVAHLRLRTRTLLGRCLRSHPHAVHILDSTGPVPVVTTTGQLPAPHTRSRFPRPRAGATHN